MEKYRTCAANSPMQPFRPAFAACGVSTYAPTFLGLPYVVFVIEAATTFSHIQPLSQRWHLGHNPPAAALERMPVLALPCPASHTGGPYSYEAWPRYVPWRLPSCLDQCPRPSGKF